LTVLVNAAAIQRVNKRFRKSSVAFKAFC